MVKATNGKEFSPNPSEQPNQPDVETNQPKQALKVNRFYKWLKKMHPSLQLGAIVLGNIIGKVAAKIAEKVLDRFF